MKITFKCVMAAGIAMTVGCGRPSQPNPPAGSYHLTHVDVGLQNGSTQSIQTAVVTDAFFRALNVEPIEGSLFFKEDFDVTDSKFSPVVMISTRLAAASGKAAGSDIYINGEGRFVRGILPESFSSPPGTAMWTTVDLKALKDKQLADKRAIQTLMQRVQSLCEEKGRALAARKLGTGPVLVAIRTREKPEWGFSSSSMDANGGPLRAIFSPSDLATLQTESLACVTSKNIPVSGRTITFFSDSTSHSEPVYTVEWKVDAIHWASGERVASRAFRDTPTFRESVARESSAIGGRYRLSFGSGEQYGDPSAAAKAWLRSLMQ
jgi:hypothetical protein